MGSTGSASGGGGDLTVEARRAFLERWLAALCDRPSLATSPELRKFMAYEDDGLCEFSSVPCNMQSNNMDAAVAHSSGGNKIDKFLSKTVSGVFHTIKDALPHFDDDDDVHDPAQNGAPSETASQLLLPMLYAPSGVRVSPVWTPAATPLAEKAASIDPRQQHQKHSLPYDVDFRFSTSEGEASEFENTLEFHVQRCEHLEKLSLHSRSEADSLQSVGGGVDSVLKEMRYRGK